MIHRVSVLVGLLTACHGASDDSKKAAPPPAPSATAAASVAPPTVSAAPEVEREPPIEADASRYGWLDDPSRPFPPVATTLYQRFAEPSGYHRIPLEAGSFGHWLRHLPLAADGTSVVSWEGDELFPGSDDYVAAVVAIDVGKKNLQHGPDVVLRLHGEWLWSRGAKRDISYEANAKLELPLERFLKGERVSVRGGTPVWLPLGKPAPEPTHEDFRDYLDSVFNWVNSRSLLTQAAEPPLVEVRPGDFLVHEGSPAEAVIILDMARHERTHRTLVLLGRALSPAQSVQVVSIGAKIPWFEISPPTPLITPRTAEFAWSGRRRLDQPKAAGDEAPEP